MTCPDLDRLVDDAVAGLPGADARLAEHADACAACLAEADCEHAPVPELRMLADAACPPDVLAAALAEAARDASDRGAFDRPARFASDRPAERAAAPSSARPVWTRRIAVGIAFAAALLVLRAVWPDSRLETPQVATMPDVPARPLGSDGGMTPQPVEIAAVPETPPVAPQIAAQPAARRPAVTRPAPRTAPVRETRGLDPVPDSTPVVPPTIELAVPDDELASVSPADSVAARSDLLLALAIVGRAQRTADDAVSIEMRRVSDALEPARTL